MDALRTAIPLARMLLAVADGRRDAVVRVRAQRRDARLEVRAGQLVGIEGVDGEPLGDALLRTGALDAIRHRAALHAAPPQGRVGPWLVAVGAAPLSAVEGALEAQLEARVTTLLRWPEPVFELATEAPRVRAECSVSVDLAYAVWDGLLSLASDLPAGTLAALAGDGELTLTRSGTRLGDTLARAAHPLDLSRILRRAPSSEQRCARAVLRALGAATDAGLDADACSLLLRKQREIRRRAGARALLDLPPSALPEQARPALRRLAHKLHPDRFQAREPELRAVSGEVMRALAQAEAELSARRPRH